MSVVSQRVLSSTIAALAVSLGGCASTAPKATTNFALHNFCAEAQQLISGTKLSVENVVHIDKQAFVLSKPAVRPLRTEQFVSYMGEAQTLPKMISCKMKTSDHIATEYGTEQTRGEGLCADINRQTLERVLQAMSTAERRKLSFDRGRNVVFDPEQRTTDGPVWLSPFALARVGADGSLHIQSRSMRNDWLDPALARAPDRFKGTRYCHLIAPQYLAAVLRGELRADE
jgi:hypothetical protein